MGMSDDVGWLSIEFRLPGDKIWMKMMSQKPACREKQKEALRRKWGSTVEIKELGSKDS
jgi:hypothetical protein